MEYAYRENGLLTEYICPSQRDKRQRYRMLHPILQPKRASSLLGSTQIHDRLILISNLGWYWNPPILRRSTIIGYRFLLAEK
jgi:hypothetical protein